MPHHERSTSPLQGRGPFALLATLCLAAWLAAPALHAEESTPRLISVSGEAQRRVAPDMATLQLQVVSEADVARDARREADAVMARAVEVLRDADVAEEDIDSTGISITPQYRWVNEPREQQLTGYEVTRSATVRVLDLANLGELLQELSDAGINRMQPPELGLQNEEQVYQQVLAEAAANARARAAAAAGALGESLGAVMSLSTAGSAPPSPRPMAMERAMLKADSAASGSDSYLAGRLAYRVELTATFALRDSAGEP